MKILSNTNASVLMIVNHNTICREYNIMSKSPTITSKSDENGCIANLSKVIRNVYQRGEENIYFPSALTSPTSGKVRAGRLSRRRCRNTPHLVLATLITTPTLVTTVIKLWALYFMTHLALCSATYLQLMILVKKEIQSFLLILKNQLFPLHPERNFDTNTNMLNKS